MIPEVLVTQYIAEDNRMTDDEEIADPLADMNETLHEIVLEYLSHEESEGNDSNDEDLSFEIVVTDSSINEIAKVYKSQYEENNAHQFSTAQRYDWLSFIGAFLCTGARRSVRGINKVIAYNKL